MCCMYNWSCSVHCIAIFGVGCHILVDRMSVVNIVISDGKEHQIHDVLTTLNCICRLHFTQLMEMLWLTLQICVWFDSPVRWRGSQPPWGAEITHICYLQSGASQLPQVICAKHLIRWGFMDTEKHVILKWLQLTIHFIYCTYKCRWAKMWLFCGNSNNMSWVEKSWMSWNLCRMRSGVAWRLLA